jgi:hypothetical protein
MPAYGTFRETIIREQSEEVRIFLICRNRHEPVPASGVNLIGSCPFFQGNIAGSISIKRVAGFGLIRAERLY